MFGHFKPVPFEPYGRRRGRWRLPRWLVLLLLGLAAGAAAVVTVQERLLPPRLSAGESSSLRAAYAQADAERRQLRAQIAQATQARDAASVAQREALAERDRDHALAERLRAELAAVVAALPPDPRGGPVAVRAGEFSAQRGQLAYQVVLTRERGDAKPLNGVLQLLVAGTGAGGADATVKLAPLSLTLGSHAVVRGSQPLPEGFKPRQTTIQVLDRPGGQSVGMRVMLVQ